VDIKTAIAVLVENTDLKFESMQKVMQDVMRGDTSPSQISSLLTALRMKGETVEEITAAATVMRAFSKQVTVKSRPIIDTCGTGGDGSNTFNISTAAAFVTAAAGGRVAKHGNRAASSKSGSADVLEAAGAEIELHPDHVATCLEETGVGFMFAPTHHNATRHASGPRREIGIRTIFNILGPLTNPANADCQLMGVFEKSKVQTCAEVLKRLGVKRAMVVHSEDGLDEISIYAKSHIAELRENEITLYQVNPSDYDFMGKNPSALYAADVKDSLEIILRTFEGEPGDAHKIVAINAGAAIYLGGLASDLLSGIKKASDLLTTGSAKNNFQKFIRKTQELSQN
jgi:anthranilate phosphoribosyltransferase